MGFSSFYCVLRVFTADISWCTYVSVLGGMTPTLMVN